MSLPAELRTICHLIASNELSKLPYITPILLRNLMCCGEVLSAGDELAKRSDASESMVLVHKFRTQISTLLYGKVPGGRFAAVVLIKAMVELGGWEILRGCEPWVKGLLLELAKPDTAAIKSICILTLASIYTQTHQYQTLVREITTPTLPTFVTSCLNVVPKTMPALCKTLNGQESLVEGVFEAFAALIPRHPTIFRPFASQIQVAARLCVAPTMSDECFIAPSLQESARRLIIVVHQTAPKNTASDEWAKAVHSYVKASHATANRVFRAVVEDWESVSGYVSEQVDLNSPLGGGSESAEDFPEWSGITAGVERLTGILALLEQCLRSSTSVAVSIPVGSIMDLITRMLSLARPSLSSQGSGNARINPAIDRDEREGLWNGLPLIHVASLQLLMSMIERLQEGFLPLFQGCVDQITWLFPFERSNEEFRTKIYILMAKLLRCSGTMLSKDSVRKISPIIKACCNDILPGQAKGSSTPKEGAKKPNSNGSNSNADTFLQSNAIQSLDSHKLNAELVDAAKELLPLCLSHLPQAHLGVPLRSQIDQTAITTHHKDAMITSVLYPLTANSQTLPSILPYLSRQFSREITVEGLLRPRLPSLPQPHQSLEPLFHVDLEDVEATHIPEEMELDHNSLIHSPKNSVPESPYGATAPAVDATESIETRALKRSLSETMKEAPLDVWGSAAGPGTPKRGKFDQDQSLNSEIPRAIPMPSIEINTTQRVADQNVSGDLEEDSDDESVASLKLVFDSSEEE